MRSTALLLLIACSKAAPPPPSPSPSSARDNVVELTVTAKGFEPSPVQVKGGQPVKLIVTRKTDTTCATEIVIPGYDIHEKLPLDTPVTVTFTPKKSGELRYGCAMDQMIAGVLIVE